MFKLSIKDKFKDFIGISDDSDYYEDDKAEAFEEEKDCIPSYSSNDNNVVNVNATTQLKVVLMKPESYAEAPKIVDNLNKHHTVVVNLEKTDDKTADTMFHFLAGAAYAIHGQMSLVANKIYVITPINVGVMGDLLDELENNGIIF